MTKEITKAYILQEIEDRFKLRELTPEAFAFSELVVPVYNIEPHLSAENSIRTDISITSAAAYVYFTVPQAEKWLLHRYNVTFMGVAGAIKIAGVYIKRLSSTVSIYLDLTKNQENSYAINLPTPVKLVAGDEIKILVDSYTSTQTLRLEIDYTQEVVR